MNYYQKFQESPFLQEFPPSYNISNYWKNVISNRYHSKSISLFLSRVGASVAHNQDNLNLPLCLHLNTSSLRSLSRSLRSLKLIIQIFSSMNKLYLPEDCLTIFYFILGVSPWSLRPPKHLDRAAWFLSCGLDKEYLWLYSPCFQFPAEIPI